MQSLLTVGWMKVFFYNTHSRSSNQKKKYWERKTSILWISSKGSEGTYLALYGESGTCVFASIDVSYSFALQREREAQQNVCDQDKGRCWPRKEKVQSGFVDFGRRAIKKQAATWLLNNHTVSPEGDAWLAAISYYCYH